MQPPLHATPRPRDVLLEQVRALGHALRVPALATAALAVVGTLLITSDILRRGVVIDFHPEHQMLPSVLGLLFPIGVWSGVKRFGADFLWTLPVDRRRHALTRVLAGWAWLMGVVAVFGLWQLALTLLSGGDVLAEETIRVLPSSSPWGSEPTDPATLQSVRWPAQPVLWLVPFTAATGSYLLASALALGTRHPLRWVVGTVFALLLLGIVGDVTKAKWLFGAPERLVELVFNGPYGMDTLFTARTESLKVDVLLTTGERVIVWRGLPHLGDWVVGTLLWTCAGLVALWAAASRHRERRRA